MSWLLWREYRRNRWILGLGAVGLFLPCLIAVLFHAEHTEIFIVVFMLSGTSSQVTVALLAGNALAGERADRSAEFVAYLPWRRVSTFASKLVLPALTAAISFVVYVWCSHQLPEIATQGNMDMADLRIFAIVHLVTYGVGWLASSLSSSVAFASCIGFISPYLVFLCQLEFNSIRGVSLEVVGNGGDRETFILAYAMLSVPVAIIEVVPLSRTGESLRYSPRWPRTDLVSGIRLKSAFVAYCNRQCKLGFPVRPFAYLRIRSFRVPS